MRVVRGKSFDEAIRISRVDMDKNELNLRLEKFDLKQSQSISKPFYPSTDLCIAHLDVLFGGSDFNYFIKNEASLKRGDGMYKVYNVEDMDGENHTIFFLIEE